MGRVTWGTGVAMGGASVMMGIMIWIILGIMVITLEITDSN